MHHVDWEEGVYECSTYYNLLEPIHADFII